MYSRTSSDTLKLRRLITSLRETGSDLAGELEDQSASFFTGVQVVRSNNANRVRFESDEEDETEFSTHTETLSRHRKTIIAPSLAPARSCGGEDHEREEEEERKRRRRMRNCEKKCE